MDRLPPHAALHSEPNEGPVSITGRHRRYYDGPLRAKRRHGVGREDQSVMLAAPARTSGLQAAVGQWRLGLGGLSMKSDRYPSWPLILFTSCVIIALTFVG